MLISDDKLSAKDVEKINDILSHNFPETSVRVSAGGPVAATNTCVQICNAAQTVAEAACDELGGIAAAVCKIAAKAAGDECRRHC